MDLIGDLLSKKSPNSALMKGIKSAMIVEYANEILAEKWGRAIENDASVVSIKDRILTVACMNGSVASEIKLGQEAIIQKMNEKFGSETVEKLKIML